MLELDFVTNREIMAVEFLTTERLRRYFKNNFDLCNFAIQIGQNMVLDGSQSTLEDVIEVVEDQAETKSEEK